jgi:cellulose synthase/poly-beta-1,6-N-acetylglucosamine synthase-like glycosyltransferase
MGLVVVVGGYLVVSFVLSRRRPPARARHGRLPRRYVFVVPALNEERVIARTLPAERTQVLVVDDGSSDATAAVVEPYIGGRVALLRRQLPEARQGKGAALNAAYRHVVAETAAAGMDPGEVVICVVDADGRMAPNALDVVDRHFRDPRIGAVQCLVRIVNRDRVLARFQDYEFVAFGALVQSARQHLGSVALGGNGQFVRLSALDSLGPEPWSDVLTEDLDLGLRLLMAGWTNAYAPETWVSQQGLLDIGRLVHQRARWSQGHFQCWRHIAALVRSDVPNLTLLDLLYYLLSPGMVLVASVVFPIPFLLAVLGAVSHPPFHGAALVVYALTLYLLSFGMPLLMTLLYWRRAGDISLWRALLLAHGLSFYNVIWYIAEWRALFRIAARRSHWTKTARLEEAAAVAE